MRPNICTMDEDDFIIWSQDASQDDLHEMFEYLDERIEFYEELMDILKKMIRT